MNIHQLETWQRCLNRGINLEKFEYLALRRISMTLSRWGELECGDSDNYKSWSIERDKETDKPYMVVHPHTGKTYQYAIPDREKGALRRLDALAKKNGFYWHHQPDPRGVALYVSSEPLDDMNYTHGVAIGR